MCVYVLPDSCRQSDQWKCRVAEQLEYSTLVTRPDETMARSGPRWESVWFPGLCSEPATRPPCSSSVSTLRGPSFSVDRPCGGSCSRSRSPRFRCSVVEANPPRRTSAPTMCLATLAPARSSAALFAASVLVFFSLLVKITNALSLLHHRGWLLGF